MPTHPAVSLNAQTSALPLSSMILGHVLLAVQRSRMPLAGKPRTGSGQGAPRLRTFAAGFVEFRRAVRQRKAQL